ncbi:MAG: tetratricopeptide repeat protein [Gammaproteobacteria bacterium]|nr:tetratricopeptide repeat protein [Gammaproteobacteria bacterium]
MNKSPDLPIRKFNPGTFQSDEEVVEQFVVRVREYDSVMEVLRGNIDSASCQHVLVTAPRGRGKTMLLARIAAELRTNGMLSDRLLPVRFMEENQEIYTMADFWLETLFHLARESAASDPTLATELRYSYDDLNKHWREQTIEERARAIVLGTADRLGKKLVLMVENLQSLCESVDSYFGWKLRGVLQSEPQIILIASSTNRFKGLDDAGQPFFELFRIIELAPLSNKECGYLWRVVSGDTVDGREIRPLQILTGGNPRLLVIIAGFAQHHSLRQLMEELVALVDEHTEYFRGHLEVLARTERRGYVAVLDLWQPSRAGEIAERARMDVRAVSTMLGRLVDRGAVLVEGSGKKRLYSAVERLYSIYYKLRRERDEAAIVQNLIRFMVAFYSETEQTEIFHKMSKEAMEAESIQEGIKRAVAELPQFSNLYSKMWSDINKPQQNKISLPAQPVSATGMLTEPVGTSKQQYENLSQEINDAVYSGSTEMIIQLTDQLINLPDVSDSSIAWALLEKANAYARQKNHEKEIELYGEVIERFGDSNNPDIQEWIAIALYKKGERQGKQGKYEAAITSYDEMVERFSSNDVHDIQWWVAVALSYKGYALEKIGDFDAAIFAYDEVLERFSAIDVPNIQRRIAMTLVDKGEVQAKLGNFGSAVTNYNEAVKRLNASDVPQNQQTVAVALVAKGNALGELDDFEAAIAAYGEVVDRYSSSNVPDIQRWVAVALLKKGDALGTIAEFEAAITTYDEIVGRFRTNVNADMQMWVAKAMNNKIKNLIQIDNPDKALQTCEELEQRLGIFLKGGPETEIRWRVLCLRTEALQLRGETQAAMELFRLTYATFVPENEYMMHEIIRVVPNLIASGASEYDLVEILSGDNVKSARLEPLIIALRQCAGEAVRAPAEMLEVAEDIRNQINEKQLQNMKQTGPT